MPLVEHPAEIAKTRIFFAKSHHRLAINRQAVLSRLTSPPISDTQNRPLTQTHSVHKEEE